MTDATQAPAPVPAPANSGLWEDFIDIFYQPSEVFERRGDGKFGLALLILVVVMTALYFALRNGLAPIMDAEIAKQAAGLAKSNPNMTADQIRSATGAMEKFAMFGTIIFVPIGVLLMGILLWLAGKLFDANVVFAAAMMIATYSMLPRVAEMIVNALQGLLLAPETFTSRYSATLGIGRFLPADSDPAVMTILGGIDVFSIWVTVLMAIGLSVVARVPLKRAAFAAAAVWFVGLLPALFGALSQSS